MGKPDKPFTLADQVLQSMSGKDAHSVQARMAFRKARRFKLSRDFLLRAYEALSPDIDVMMARCELARLPFEYMWIEFEEADQEAGRLSKNMDPAGEGVMVGQAGFFLRRTTLSDPSEWGAQSFYGRLDEGWAASAPLVMWFANDLAKEWREMDKGIAHQKEMTEYASGMGWGFMAKYNEHDPGTAYVTRQMLNRGMMSIEWDYMRKCMKRYGVSQDNWMNQRSRFLQMRKALIDPLLQSHQGDLAILINTLALINHVPTRTIHVPRTGSYTKRLKNYPYLDYQKIEIDTARVRSEKTIGRLLSRAANDARRHRAHEVRGHWRYYLEMPSCSEVNHEWEELDPNHHRCLRCDTRRTWIDAHQRGDASIGYVTHDYEVVK